ncbi:hypothetical protein ACIP98_25335 [Streptomyces sp. NPDC088354]|uniref:hypothetical protein n=1 Tax=unclassified Streptomyces TaxID=2593676 RepID=UPI0029BE16B7|nr:hypothetical protein [Streptomyces sp. MI02-7b]MDX3077738.1 hypothetical protein [Streptomyces sp. MI02-7b]
MTAPRASRRAAGSHNAIDLLLSLTFIKRRTPARDAADLLQGQTLELVALSRTLGRVVLLDLGKGRQIQHLKIGALFVTQGRPLVWRERRTKQETVLDGPFTLTRLDKKVPLNGRLAFYELTTADGSHEVALPKKDAPLVLLAISRDSLETPAPR